MFMLRPSGETVSRCCVDGELSCNDSIHQSILDRIMSEFSIVSRVHFFQDPGPVRIDGADTDGQLVGDILEAPADGNEAHNLILAIRQLLMERFFQAAFQISRQ